MGDPPDPCYDFTAGLSCQPMKLSVCPAGDFEWIRNGCGGTDDYVWVTVRSSGVPLPGIPPTDFWMNACDPARQICLCAGAVLADSATGADGRTTISGPLRAGGCVPAGGLQIAVQGIVIYDPQTGCTAPLCLAIIVKSPDLTGSGGAPDCVVNLSDLIPFGMSYNSGLGQPGYNDCCDYNDDYKVNLSDFAYFGSHYQHHCP